jgi:hypothetical protein
MGRPKGHEIVDEAIVATNCALAGKVGGMSLVRVIDAVEDSAWIDQKPEPVVSPI